jgi:hypothetical protein
MVLSLVILKMTDFSILYRIKRILTFVVFNIVWIVLLWALIDDDPRRKPVLFILIPLMLLADVGFLWRIFKLRTNASFTLPIIYLIGLVVGVGWIIYDFEWWKIFVIIFPLIAMIISGRRLMKSMSSGTSTEKIN